jgi:hypothetical protein
VRVKSLVVCTILVAVLQQTAAAKPAVAPADEYFGRMKLSILGIGNILHDTKLREAYDPAHAADNYTKLSFAEDALEDWATKYPQDNWLPAKAYFMSHEFWAMNTPDGDRAAERCRALLMNRLAKSPFSIKAHGEIASMFAPATSTDAVASSTASAAVPAVASDVATPAVQPPATPPHS